MPEIKDSEITEDELLGILERNLDASDTYNESLIGPQRDRAWRYYYGEPLGNEIKGRSHHVSLDVFDAVESTKALLLDTFTADRNVCRFTPQTPMDIDKARQATAWVNYLFYRQNDGYKILHDTVHDGLVAKLGVVKRWWDKRHVYIEEEFENIPPEQFVMLASQPDVELTDHEQTTVQEALVDPMTGIIVSPAITTHSGKLKRKVDKSQVRVVNVEPEKLHINPDAKSLETADFVSYRHEVEIGELLEDGYDEEKIELLDRELATNSTALIGRDSFDYQGVDAKMLDDHPNRQKVTIYESYLRIYDPGLESRVTMKVIHSKRVLLDLEKVESHPYRGWTPFPIPHKAIGMSLADVMLDIQKSQSSLKRSVIDNSFMTNTTRWLANLSLVRNPRDLIDNKVGAVIDVNAMDPGAVVQPLNVPQISPNVFTTMEVLEQEKEARSGSSRMSKGLDSDVVSKQNSSDLITRYMNASNRRTMVMARNFAESFLKPLLFDLYRLSLENDNQQRMVMLEGQYVQIAPAELEARTEMDVDVALTPDARAADARTLTMLDQMWTANPQNPTLNGMYDTPQRFALLSDAMELMGLKGGNRYLLPPMAPEYQQKMQAQGQQAQQDKQMAQQMEFKKVELEERKVVTDERRAGVEEGKLMLEAEKASNEFSIRAQDILKQIDKDETDTVLKAVELKNDFNVRSKQADNQRMAMEAKQENQSGV